MPNNNQSQEELSFKKPTLKSFSLQLFLFFLTLILGIATSFRIDQILMSQGVQAPKVPVWQFLFSFFFATLILFLIIRFIRFRKQKGLVFRILFVFAVFGGGTLMMSAWFLDAVSLILMTSLIIWWWKKPTILIQDICMILGIAGAGSVLGLTLEPEKVIIFLIFFSIYDLIAVYKTKHMVEMAKEMVKSRAILGLVIPPDISGFKESLDGVKPGGKFMVLGGGDIVFPLLLCSSLVPFGILKPLVVSFFSLAGFLFSSWFFVSQKKRKPIPALPPIAFFSIIGFLITRLF
jgi:presenilin-like A22 family membrane protease